MYRIVGGSRLAHFQSPWATLAILAAYSVAGACALWRDREAARRARAAERER